MPWFLLLVYFSPIFGQNFVTNLDSAMNSGMELFNRNVLSEVNISKSSIYTIKICPFIGVDNVTYCFLEGQKSVFDI